MASGSTGEWPPRTSHRRFLFQDAPPSRRPLAVRADRRRVVCVAVTASTAEDEERMQERSRLLLDEVFKHVR